jgi:hypothetical protein
MISGFWCLILIMLGLGATAVWQIGMFKRLSANGTNICPGWNSAAPNARPEATYAIWTTNSPNPQPLGAGRDTPGASARREPGGFRRRAGEVAQPAADLLLRTRVVGDLEAAMP